MDLNPKQTDTKKTSFSELFTQCVSDITIEVEKIKIKNMRSDFQGINGNISRINSALMRIMDARLEILEKGQS